MGLLDPALRRVIATRETAFKPYNRYGEPIPGLSWIPLSDDSEFEGRGCYLLRFDPGAASRPHEHSEVEEFLVMEGALVDSDGRVLKAGDFVSYEAGSQHYSTAPDGCTILVFLRAGNRLLPGADG